MATRSTYWDTAAELEHIAGLGTFNEGSEKIPRQQWLSDYLDAMRLRVEWESIDRVKVLTCAQKELNELKRDYKLMVTVTVEDGT